MVSSLRLNSNNIGSWCKTRTCHQSQGTLNKRLAELFRVCRIMHMEPRNVLPWTAGQGVMRASYAPYFIDKHSALCDKKRAGKYNKYTYRLLTILYKTSYSKYCMTLHASVCCDSCLCGLCLHYHTTTCIYSYVSRIYHYVTRLYIIEGYSLSHRLKCL